jgi:hypothetical protein
MNRKILIDQTSARSTLVSLPVDYESDPDSSGEDQCQAPI